MGGARAVRAGGAACLAARSAIRVEAQRCLWANAARRLRHRDAEKERDRQADLLKERRRQVHADNEAAGSDDEAEPWRRRPYVGSRRAQERRRRREVEAQEDAQDEAREEEQAAARAAAEEAARAAKAEVQAAGLAQAAQQEAAHGFDASDAIMAAMMAAVKGDAEHQPQPAAEAAPRLAPAAPKRSRVVNAAFAEDDEEQKPQRKLIPIRCGGAVPSGAAPGHALASVRGPQHAYRHARRYTDEELQAMHATSRLGEDDEDEERPPANGAGAPAGPSAAADPNVVKKQIMASIPKNWDGIAGFALRWSELDGAPADVKARVAGGVLRLLCRNATVLCAKPTGRLPCPPCLVGAHAGWVSKKVQELLGAPEPSFCDFIMSQLSSHTPPQQLLESLADVLDEDAPSFTQKLFQVVIYETERLALLPAGM